MRGDGGNHHDKLGIKRILCASQLTIPDTAGTTPDSAGKNTDMRSSKRNQASCTPDFSYPLVSSIFILIFIPHLSFATIIADHKVKSSLSISPCHDQKLTLSTAYTESSIHWMQHTPKIVGDPFILTITSWPLTIASPSGIPPYKIDCHQPAPHERSKVKSPHQIPTIAS